MPYFSPVSIATYDIRGKLMEKIVSDNFEAGNYIINLNAQKYPSGMYFYRFENGIDNQVKKFMVLK